MTKNVWPEIRKNLKAYHIIEIFYKFVRGLIIEKAEDVQGVFCLEEIHIVVKY